jgi:CheY-like chemotaxis protein
MASDRYRKPRRVLFLAHPEIADACQSSLETNGFTVVRPTLPHQGTTAAARWLFDVSLPAVREIRTERWRDLLRKGRGAATIGRPGDAPLFAWSDFEAVIIQDLWITEANGGQAPESLAAGCFLAWNDYYIHGHFVGKKVVLVTDGGFFSRGGDGAEEVRSQWFDASGQIVFVSLLGPAPLAALLSALGGSETRPRVESTAPVDLRRSLSHRVSQALMQPLRSYVFARADVVVVDDDRAAVRGISEACGRSIDSSSLPDGYVHMVSVAGEQAPLAAKTFAGLLEKCRQSIVAAASHGKPLIVVTDILFDHVEWSTDDERRTGLDLIRALRDEEPLRAGRLAVIAFTGLVSPFIIMSAHEQGADAVVFKTDNPSHLAHAAFDPEGSGVSRLLHTAAYICFQWQFLRELRSQDREAGEQIGRLHRILPAHVVPPHLRTEWNDTQYVIESRATYGRSMPRHVKETIEQLQRNYGD